MAAFSYILLLAVMSMLCLQVRLYSFGNGEECIFPEQLSSYSVPSFTSCLYAFVFVFVFKFVSVEVRVRKDSSSDREPAGRGRLAQLPWRQIRVQVSAHQASASESIITISATR